MRFISIRRLNLSCSIYASKHTRLHKGHLREWINLIITYPIIRFNPIILRN
nr:MAG TPA: hypothetical protein [Caudoviricetes sp.]